MGENVRFLKFPIEWSHKHKNRLFLTHYCMKFCYAQYSNTQIKLDRSDSKFTVKVTCDLDLMSKVTETCHTVRSWIKLYLYKIWWNSNHSFKSYKKFLFWVKICIFLYFPVEWAHCHPYGLITIHVPVRNGYYQCSSSNVKRHWSAHFNVICDLDLWPKVIQTF